MPTYTVIGIYSEPLGQRYATTVDADSPEDAERMAHKECADANGVEDAGLMVAGVVAGDVALLDMYTDGHTAGVPRPDET